MFQTPREKKNRVGKRKLLRIDLTAVPTAMKQALAMIHRLVKIKSE